MFKRIGDCCGGLVVVDSGTKNFMHLQWARLYVKVEGGDFPWSLQMVISSSYYAIQLWWEVPSCLLVVVSMKLRNKAERVATHVG